ncbi:homocysteine S-methyltransferase family protein [Rhodobacteraceae bacterium N5(2021)]|uniref:Homocysteine S-methyltransferase family protein n=1 Tax=Gymnodinialimonas phycosphaerae TaxID=2841589 RepID=A0A975TVL5_9RHOB|nr:homocysteine S-methyltransferase family protein [Gymnodinialimonas phycosphaerae]MBY4891420.1 homocysteine S-methyltransferase family protein [Gymnodinialimonas phycosphaerae]
MTEITILDGGMGQELVARSGMAPTALWSTDVMRAQPHLVGEIHRDFFRAGAQIATANTYAIHRDRLVRAEAEDEFAALHATALEQALKARDAHGAGRVAGAIGPLGASYRADLTPQHSTAVALYAEIATLHVPHVDLLICETITSLAQAEALVDGVLGLGVPVWLAFSVDDKDGTRLRSGEALADVLPMVGGAAALLANCSVPEVMPDALEILSRAGLPFGAYANGFTEISAGFLGDAPTVDALTSRTDMGPEAYADHVMGWIDQGATIVGGCCEVSPAHIAEIARRVNALGRGPT